MAWLDELDKELKEENLDFHNCCQGHTIRVREINARKLKLIRERLHAAKTAKEYTKWFKRLCDALPLTVQPEAIEIDKLIQFKDEKAIVDFFMGFHGTNSHERFLQNKDCVSKKAALDIIRKRYYDERYVYTWLVIYGFIAFLCLYGIFNVSIRAYSLWAVVYGIAKLYQLYYEYVVYHTT